MMKYVFMGSPPFAATILESLCNANLPPEAVVTQQAKAQGRGRKTQCTAVESWAKERGLAIIATDNVNHPDVVETLRQFSPEICLVAAFGQIFKKPILELPAKFCLNVHASLLPRYRGAAPIQWAIWNGDHTTGVCLQKMEAALDAGDVLASKEIEIGPQETTGELLERMGPIAGKLSIEAFQSIAAGNYTFVPQQEAQVTYAPKIEKSHGEIDWTRGATKIFNQIRALRPWPVAYAHLGENRLKVFRATIEEKTFGQPGEIDTDKKTYLSVQCGDARVLSMLEVQAENRKRMPIAAFLNAFQGNFPFQKMGSPS